VFGWPGSGPPEIVLRPSSKSPVEQEEPVDLHLGTAKPLSKIASCGPPPDGRETGEAVMGDTEVGDAEDGESVGFAVGNAVGYCMQILRTTVVRYNS
jgi:hypothetical protein